MTTVDVDDVLNDLKAALDVEPSAELVPGVRRRMRHAPEPRAGLFRPRALALAALAIAIVGSFVIWPRTSRETRVSAVPAERRVPTVAAVARPTTPVPLVPIGQPVSVSRQDAGVLIPPGEIAAMRALLNASTLREPPRGP